MFPHTSNAEALFARAKAANLSERLSRVIQRKALRCAAAWEGPLKDLRLSINLLPEDVSRDGFDQWLLDEISAAGMDPAPSSSPEEMNGFLQKDQEKWARVVKFAKITFD